MDGSQLVTVDTYRNGIIDCIQTNIENALQDFAKDGAGPRGMGILVKNDIDAIRVEATPYAQTIKLIRVLQQRDHGFGALERALRHYGRDRLADTLVDEGKGFPLSNGVPIMAATNIHVPSSEDPAKHAKLPKLWNAPLKQNRFVGRNDILRYLTKLQNRSIDDNKHESFPTKIFAVCIGMGGVGKSSIALEFIYLNLHKYKHVIWVPATTIEGIENCLAELGAQLCLPTSNSNVLMWREAMFWLQANPGWLIVFDDASKFSEVRSYIPRTGGLVLATSRYTEWPCQTLPITPFTNEETTEYLQLVVSSAVDKEECVALAQALGNLPLAISQATAHMSELRIGVPEYLVKFKAAQCQLLSNTVFPPDCDSEPVYYTWNVSVEQAKLECGFAAELLAFCSLLDHNNVPQCLIWEFVKVRNCSQLLEKAQTVLYTYSLMSISPSTRRGMSMHPLVQVATKSTLSNDKVNEYIKDALTCIENVWPNQPKLNHSTVRDVYPSLEMCLQYMKLEGEAVEEQSQPLILHVQHKILSIAKKAYKILGYHQLQHALLKRMNKSAKYSGAILCNHLLAAKLWHDLGNAYGLMGNYKKQNKHLTNALRIKQNHYGSDHTEVAATLHCLGNAYGSLGVHQQEKDLLQKALAIREKHYGITHTKVAATLVYLGIAYNRLRDYHKAKELYQKALVITENKYGSEHVEVAVTLDNLGNVYTCLGDCNNAKELHEKALMIKEKHYGLDHVEVATTIHNLGTVFCNLCDYHKAKQLHEKALVIREKHYGPDHTNVAITLNSLGNAYTCLGDYNKAKELYEKALLIEEKHYGPDYGDVAVISNNLGNMYYDFGDYYKAKELFEKAPIVMEKHYGPDHALVADATNHKARELYEKSLMIQEKHHGPDHTEVAVTLNNLGHVYYNLGDYHKARELYEKTLMIQEKHHGPDHTEVAVTLNNLGHVYKNLGDYHKAKELCEKALVIQEKHYGPDHTEVAVTLNNLGQMHYNLGDYHKAKKLCEKALVIREKHHGPDHTEVAVTLNNLGHVYKNLGDNRIAKELCEKALVIQEKHYGPDHAEGAAAIHRLGYVDDHFNEYHIGRHHCKKTMVNEVKTMIFEYESLATVRKRSKACCFI